MQITERIQAGTTTLTLSRRFDFQARKPFQDAIRKAHAEPSGPVLLNLTHIPFVDSAALGLLALAHENLKRAHRPLILVAPQVYVQKVFELANFHQLMPIYSTEQEGQGHAALTP